MHRDSTGVSSHATEVGSCGKRDVSGSSQHNYPTALISLGGRQPFKQAFQNRDRHRVPPLRPVDGDPGCPASYVVIDFSHSPIVASLPRRKQRRYLVRVWLLIATALAAIAVVLVTRGDFARLSHVKVSAFWLLAVGLVLQATLEFIDFSRPDIDTIGYGLLMLSYVSIMAFCVVNFPARGFVLITIGVALNALVIGLNQGMPTRPIGNDSHGNRVFKPVEQTVKHRQESASDQLGFLGDKILFPKPFDTLVSVGDLVIAIGICELAYYGTRRLPTSTSKYSAV